MEKDAFLFCRIPLYVTEHATWWYPRLAFIMEFFSSVCVCSGEQRLYFCAERGALRKTQITKKEFYYVGRTENRIAE